MVTILCGEHRFETIEAVLFDKDGTLANVESYLIALAEARAAHVERVAPGTRADSLRAAGVRIDVQGDGCIDPAGLMAVGSRTENEVAAAAYVAATGVGWTAALRLVREAFDRAAVSLPVKVGQTPLIEGAIALIQRLNSSGVAVGIVSSDTHAEVAAFVAHHGLAVQWYCGEGGATLSKPQAGFLKFACGEMGVMPSSVLVIGDSASDVALSAQGAAGFVGMVGGWGNPPVFGDDMVTATHLSQVETPQE